MGSTIIVLFGKDNAQWNDDLIADKAVKLREMIGKTIPKTSTAVPVKTRLFSNPLKAVRGEL